MGCVEAKKEAPKGLSRECEDWLADPSFKIQKDTFEVGLVKDLFLFSSAQQESAAAHVVDLAGDAFGMIVNSAHKAVAEEWALAASDAEVVFDIAGGLFQVEGFEIVADGDALVEGFIGRKTKLVSQVRLAEKDEGEGRSGIHLVVEQEAELVKELRGQEVSFVDDEEDETTSARQVREGGAELREKTEEAESGLGLELEEDLAVEGDNGEVRIG
jgi:hypothetical protein